jgi:hypothetical protein
LPAHLLLGILAIGESDVTDEYQNPWKSSTPEAGEFGRIIFEIDYNFLFHIQKRPENRAFFSHFNEQISLRRCNP